MKNIKQRYFTAFLFAIYFLALIWIIVLKMHFSLSDITDYRSVNLIPLKGSAYGELSQEVLNNVYIFIPFGIYLSILKDQWVFLQKTLTIAFVSAAFEGLQYFLAIGVSDITDIIANTLGGVVGIIFYHILSAIFKSKTTPILNGFAFLITLVSSAFFSLRLI
jgi:glycopeptide antibiotics resistance protein